MGMIFNRFFFCMASLLCVVRISTAQCEQQVTHTVGTIQLNGTTVGVTSSGLVDTFTTYCKKTLPYFIGYKWGFGGGNGYYTFTFNPAVSSLTLNFSGISEGNVAMEAVRLYVNNSHYSLSTVGAANGCDALAVINSFGDIAACGGCAVSGWEGTVITGNISSLTVKDTMVMGMDGGGSLFSLFICTDITTGVSQQRVGTRSSVYPAPFENFLSFTTSEFEQSEVIVSDLSNKVVYSAVFTGSVQIDTESFPPGIYFYTLRRPNRSQEYGRIVKP